MAIVQLAPQFYDNIKPQITTFKTQSTPYTSFCTPFQFSFCINYSNSIPLGSINLGSANRININLNSYNDLIKPIPKTSTQLIIHPEYPIIKEIDSTYRVTLQDNSYKYYLNKYQILLQNNMLEFYNE
jgi:hypothetical protein